MQAGKRIITGTSTMVSMLIELFALAPIRRGFFAFLAAGMTFPLIGLFVVVMNLFPLRFTLMHGALLGGVIGLLTVSEGILFPLIVNLIIAALLGPASDRMKLDVSNTSVLFMMGTIATAFFIIDRANLPAMEAFSVFWGSIYALTTADLVVLYALSAAIPIFMILNRRRINAVLFDRDIAFSTGIDSRRFFYIILMLTGTVVAVSMKIVGALLTDSLLILPALAALSLAKSMRGMFVISVVFGFLSALFGFLFSLVMEVQPGPAVTLVSLVLFAGFYAIQAIQNRKGVSA